MGARTYSTEALVLGKANLGEADLIVRMMDAEGCLREAVAKGARRPQGSLSGRMELFNRVRVHCASGKSLDVVREARLLRGGNRLHADPARGAAAACVAEFAVRTIQPDLPVPRYFDLTDAAFAALDGAALERLGAIVAAYVFKASAMIGMRPAFAACACCGAPAPSDAAVRMSFADGGFVCDECAASFETLPVDANLLRWAEALLRGRFSELSGDALGEPPAADLLAMADQWARIQADVRLKGASSLAAYLAASEGPREL